MSHCQGHHVSQCQTHAGLHPGLTAEIVKLETEAVIQTAIDPLQCVASLITALPGRVAMGSGSKNPWSGRVQINSNDTPIISGLANSLLVAGLPTLARHPGSRCRATVLQRVAVALKALECHGAFLTRLRASTVDIALP